ESVFHVAAARDAAAHRRQDQRLADPPPRCPGRFDLRVRRRGRPRTTAPLQHGGALALTSLLDLHCAPSKVSSVEQLLYVLGRTAEHRALAANDDRPLDEDRVLDHRFDPLRVRERLPSVLGFEDLLASSYQLPRLHPKREKNRLELFRRRRLFQVFDDLGLDAVFLQEGEGSAALAAARIVVDLERGHPRIVTQLASGLSCGGRDSFSGSSGVNWLPGLRLGAALARSRLSLA